MKILKIATIVSLSFIMSACTQKIVNFEEAPKYEPKISEEAGPLQTQPFQEKNLNQISNEINQKSSEQEKRETVKVIKVVDGDTIVYIGSYGKERIGRLIGINTPENTKEKQLYGQEATDFLRSLVLGKEIEIESDPNADITDKYGRYLVHAFIGGRSVQYLLILEGLARVAYLYDEYQYVDMYKEAEAVAKKEDLNIWSIPGYVDGSNGFNMDEDAVSNVVEDKILEGFNLIKEKITSK